jgi:23S rRNA pseudouridine1911/1915/1917 synthase
MKQTPLFAICYEDDEIIAVNKKSGAAVKGDRWDPAEERLDTALEKTISQKVFAVHRIDKDTSGIVLFAKNAESHRGLSLAFENHLIKKQYTAVVYGRVPWEETACDLPLTPDGNKRHLTIIDKYRGKKSFTAFKRLITAGNFSVIACFPKTGRAHQIRVHISALEHPIICDALYCRNPKPVYLSDIKRGWRGDPFSEKPLLSRLGLHASELVLPDGRVFSAPLQRDMAALIAQMEKNTR